MSDKIIIACTHCKHSMGIDEKKLAAKYGQLATIACPKCKTNFKITVDASVFNNKQKVSNAGFKTEFTTDIIIGIDSFKSIGYLSAEGEMTKQCQLSLKVGDNQLGRSHMVTDDEKMSRNHAVLVVVQRNEVYQYFLKDSGSLNGTYLDQYKLMPDEEVKIGYDTPFRLGRTYFKLKS